MPFLALSASIARLIVRLAATASVQDTLAARCHWKQTVYSLKDAGQRKVATAGGMSPYLYGIMLHF
jgi:hypothetical protein